MKNNFKEIEIESLVNNKAWENTKSIYYNNKSDFDLLSTNLSKSYKIDSKLSSDAILYEIMSCQYGNNKLFFNKNIFKWIIIYLGVFLFIFLSSFISLFIFLFRKKISTDIFYEEMWPNNSLYKRFYTYIDETLDNKNIKKIILLTSPTIGFFKENIQGWNAIITNRRYSNVLFSFNISMKIIIKDLFFIRKLISISKKSNINYIYIYIRIIRKLLMYASQSDDIKAKILIAAGDYYWNPLKYHMYKRHIDNIILIQHNYINEYLHLRLFQYCDYYYAHSQQAIDKHALCGEAEFFNVGSFQLIPFLDKKNTEYDIAFISQTVYQDLVSNWKGLDQKKLQEAYHKLIKNLYTYLKRNPTKKAIYISKKGHETMNPTIKDKKYFSDLENIEFLSTAGKETFEIISKSNIVINMYSSVGFESYGLDKKVLWINYDRCCDIFKYDTKDEDLHIMISDKSFEAFSEKIELLLSDDINVINHYKKLKIKYMNIQKNPAKIMADKIKILMEELK